MISFATKHAALAQPLALHYGTPPQLPSSDTPILEHAPLALEPLVVQPNQITLHRLPFGGTYRSIVAERPDVVFADAHVMDVLIAKLYPDGKNLDPAPEVIYLKRFVGKIFFFGTTFGTAIHPQYACLNLNTIFSGIRYLYHANELIRSDVRLYACVYTK